MAQFRKGAEAVQAAAASKGGGRFAPIFQFKAGEDKYIQFLQPMDEVLTVMMHRFIIVGQREDGSPVFERFISRRDPALDGPDGYDEIWERFGVAPTERSIALAVELDPVFQSGSGRRKVIEGFDLAERQFERDGETKTVPAFGLVIESPRTFFNHLAAIADVQPIEDVVFAVKRTGNDKNTSYTFIPTTFEALDVEEEFEEFTKDFDLEEWLDNLADEDRMRELIEPLPSDWRISKYGGKKGQKDDEDEKPRRASRRRQAQSVPDDDAADAADDGDEPEEKTTTGSRSRRFQQLRETTTKRS